MTPPLRVLLNPHAGGRTLDPEDLRRELESEGVPALVEAVDPVDLGERVSACSDPLIGIAGGDGSQRTAAAALVGSGRTLAAIPTGRLNHFARRAGIDTIPAAAQAIRAGRSERVSVGRVNGKVFLNTAVVGAYGDFVNVRERLRPVLSTWPAAGIGAFLVFLRWPRVTTSVRTPDHELDCRTAMLWVGVGRDSFPEPHEAPRSAGGDALQVVVLPGGRSAAVGLATALLRYRFRGRDALAGESMEMFHAPWIEVESGGAVPIVLDGEPRILEPPVRLAIEANALRLVVGPA